MLLFNNDNDKKKKKKTHSAYTHLKGGGSGTAVAGGKENGQNKPPKLRTDKISLPSLTPLPLLGELSLGRLFCPFSFPFVAAVRPEPPFFKCARK